MCSMSTQGLLSTVFSCSSPNSKTMFKRKLSQSRSLDPALIRHDESETSGATTDRSARTVRAPHTGDAGHHLQTSHPTLDSKPTPAETLSIVDDTFPCSFSYFDYDSKVTKRNAAWDSPFLGRSPVLTGSSSALFSPIKWLQKKSSQPSHVRPDAVWRSEGDFTWNSMSGRSVRLKAVPLQSLSELERVRLQEVAFSRLIQDYDLNCQISIPKDGQKRKKSLRVKLDSLAKEKSKDKESTPRAFGIPLSQVISNGRAALRQRQENPRGEEPRDPSDLVTFHLASSSSKRAAKELSSSNSSLSSASETPSESPSPHTPEPAPRARRRGGVSVDCITDLDDSQSRLLEALQLSLPAETPGGKKKHRDKKLSLNPIYRQVPRVVDSCCQHLERFGLQTVGIFRVGSSKKRVRQLREECDQGAELQLEEEHSVHDVAALLKEFLRDMPDPLLTRELYTAFINTLTILAQSEQECVMQLLVYLLPACNSDTLQCLLHFLSRVAAHAGDSQDTEGHEITGNKMTSLNLATIFGPNLLHKQKSSDKEFAVQSFARAEESTAVIGVVQRMIDTHETLFMVPPDLQNEVLMSLLETDPDVVDYLLRRKNSQYSGPGLLRTEDSFSLDDRRSSSDSNKASSGEVSPYDNNSPVLPDPPPVLCPLRGGRDERSPPLHAGVFRVSEQHRPVGRVGGRPGDARLTPDTDTDIWAAYHGALRGDVPELRLRTGRHGDTSERGSPELLGGHRGNGKPPVRRTHTSSGVPECRPHPPLARCSSSPQEWRGPPAPPAVSPSLRQRRRGRADDPAPCSSSGRVVTRGDGRPPPPYPGPLRGGGGGGGGGGHISHSTPSLLSHQPGRPDPQPPPQGRGPETQTAQPETGPLEGGGAGAGAPAWQTDRWQVWRLLSTDSVDTLPETLV